MADPESIAGTLLDIPQAIRVNVEKVYSITAMVKGLG